jgi:hypothetical protein
MVTVLAAAALDAVEDELLELDIDELLELDDIEELLLELLELGMEELLELELLELDTAWLELVTITKGVELLTTATIEVVLELDLLDDCVELDLDEDTALELLASITAVLLFTDTSGFSLTVGSSIDWAPQAVKKLVINRIWISLLSIIDTVIHLRV